MVIDVALIPIFGILERGVAILAFDEPLVPHGLKIFKMSHPFSILAFPLIFVRLKVSCPVTLFEIKIQVSKKSSKYTIFVHSKCKRSSLRSQCLMRLFL